MGEPAIAGNACAHVAVAVSTGLIGGVLGAIAVIIVALIVGFVVYRRVAVNKQKKMMEDYASQLQMV